MKTKRAGRDLLSSIGTFRLTTLSMVVAIAGSAGNAVAQDRSGSGAWQQYAKPEAAGFSSKKLKEARKIAETERSGAVMMLYRGKVVFAWGDVERRFKSHSVRKSLMSALIGIHVDNGAIDPSKTMADLGIDDINSLTETEKQARIVDLLRARSGIYHTVAKEPTSMKAGRPDRGSHAPGTNWSYNNWDFNTLGAIFEMETGLKIFEDFKARIADPIGMEDFRLRDGIYEFEPSNSRYPAYAFRMSARDFARFGQLFLQRGRWGDRQVVPESWVAESTSMQTTFQNKRGYGYMWWIYPAGVFGEEPNRAQSNRYDKYSATGTGGQFILVIPEAEIVFVHRGDTDNDRRVSGSPIWNMVDICLAARTDDRKEKRNPKLIALTPVPFENTSPAPVERTARTVSPGVWRPLLGRYEVTPQVWIELFEYQNRLFGRTHEGEEREFFAESETTYFSPISDLVLEFALEVDGSVSSVVIHIDGRRVPARKAD